MQLDVGRRRLQRQWGGNGGVGAPLEKLSDRRVQLGQAFTRFCNDNTFLYARRMGAHLHATARPCAGAARALIGAPRVNWHVSIFLARRQAHQGSGRGLAAAAAAAA